MSAERSVAEQINRNYLGDEEAIVAALADRARLAPDQQRRIAAQAKQLVEGVRDNQKERSGLDAFLRQYDLSSQEGVILMCLAEALLRIPDDATADKLIADKITRGDWASHFGEAESLFVNASTWGLMLTGRIVRPADEDVHDPRGFVARIAGRLGEPVEHRHELLAGPAPGGPEIHQHGHVGGRFHDIGHEAAGGHRHMGCE